MVSVSTLGITILSLSARLTSSTSIAAVETEVVTPSTVPTNADRVFRAELKSAGMVKQNVPIANTVQTDWKWNCPRRGTASKTFKWNAALHDRFVKIEALQNIDYFEGFRANGEKFAANFHTKYCVQEKSFTCVYKVQGTTNGEIQGNHLALGLGNALGGTDPIVKEACMETPIQVFKTYCPDMLDSAFRNCKIVSIATKNI